MDYLPLSVVTETGIVHAQLKRTGLLRALTQVRGRKGAPRSGIELQPGPDFGPQHLQQMLHMLQRLPDAAIADLARCAAIAMTERSLGQRAGFRVRAFATRVDYERELAGTAREWRGQPVRH
jgi:hypothetical protein